MSSSPSSSLADKINEDIIELYGHLVITTDDQQVRLEYFEEFAVSRSFHYFKKKIALCNHTVVCI
jgi:hypothetical protein